MVAALPLKQTIQKELHRLNRPVHSQLKTRP